ncbi:hypothetical protein ACSQ67_016649 [Phaseolus vulgaris]
MGKVSPKEKTQRVKGRRRSRISLLQSFRKSVKGHKENVRVFDKSLVMMLLVNLRKPVYTKVDQLKPGTNRHTLVAKVLSSDTVVANRDLPMPITSELLSLAMNKVP